MAHMHRIFALGFAASIALGNLPAVAAECTGGRQLTLTGELEKQKERSDFLKQVEKNIQGMSPDSGLKVLRVAKSSPCDVDNLVIESGRVPASCVGGATFTASGTVEDDIDLDLVVTSISCR